MNDLSPQQQLSDAEEAFALAFGHLTRLRRAALFGHYDPDEFDQAVFAYRAAEAAVRLARLALAGESGEPEPASTAPATPEGAPLAITPRLLFVRWLVQTGRLTEFPGERESWR